MLEKGWWVGREGYGQEQVEHEKADEAGESLEVGGREP